jgi:biotin transporter BioY
MRVPLPIPESLAQRTGGFFKATLPMVLYRLFLLFVLGVVLYGMAQSGGYLIAFLAASLIAAFVLDDIQAVVVDLWNANFAEVKLW